MKKIIMLLAVVLLVSSIGGSGVYAEEIDYGEDEETYNERFIDGKWRRVGKIAGRKLDIKAAPYNVKATPSKQKIQVDGELVSFRAYAINGNNYFMLRDVAYIFKNTMVEFDVEWDNVKKAIGTKTGKTYTGEGVGFNMKTPHKEEKGTKNIAKIYKDGEEIYLLGYVIQGNTYFKLRDLGRDYGFEVRWDSVTNTVIMESDPDREEKEAERKKKEREKAEQEENERLSALEDERIEKEFREVIKREEEKLGLEVIEGYKERYGDSVKLELDEVIGKEEPYTGEELRRQLEIIVELINAERAQLGRQPLVLDAKLIEMSNYKVNDMHKTNNFSHTGAYGDLRDLGNMFNVGGYLGENVSQGYMTGTEIFEGFYNSPGHYANMINPKFSKIGIGIVPKDDNPFRNIIYWCAMNLAE